MEFEEAIRRLIESLENMDYIVYTERFDIKGKNKLFTGDVDVDFVLDLIENCNERENYFPRDSWDADDFKSHIFKVNDWYIKYIIKNGIVNIISVHED